MQELKYKFKYKELINKGFTLDTNGDDISLIFLQDKDDFINSKFITTQDVNDVEWYADIFQEIDYMVFKPTGEEIGEPYMTEQEIDEYIKQAKNGK